jgi:hypothetical protein
VTPSRSSGGGTLGATAGTIRTATANATTPSGTLIRKIQRQLPWVVMIPPASGAITGASRAGQTM